MSKPSKPAMEAGYGGCRAPTRPEPVKAPSKRRWTEEDRKDQEMDEAFEKAKAEIKARKARVESERKEMGLPPTRRRNPKNSC